jgi:uncharacterized membrane protein YecN with MAPEG domain
VTIAIICVALLAALVFVLGANVSRLRGSATTQAPTALDDPLFVAIRAHGNAAEYVPTLAVLILLVGSRQPATWMLVLFVVGTAARYIHAVGVLAAGDMSKPAPLRMVGAVLTYLSGLALVAAAIVVV